MSPPFQFSLAKLIAAMTVACIGMALISRFQILNPEQCWLGGGGLIECAGGSVLLGLAYGTLSGHPFRDGFVGFLMGLSVFTIVVTIVAPYSR